MCLADRAGEAVADAAVGAERAPPKLGNAGEEAPGAGEEAPRVDPSLATLMGDGLRIISSL